MSTKNKPSKNGYNLLSKGKTLKMEYIGTPEEIWEDLSKEFKFTVDACASSKNHLVKRYWTKENSALDKNWDNEVVYCHPMYDGKIPKFVKKSFEHNCLTVFLLPSSTNSVYFHKYFWDFSKHQPKKNVEVRFLKKAKDLEHGYKMKTDEGVTPEYGYLRPLMVVVVDNRHILTGEDANDKKETN